MHAIEQHKLLIKELEQFGLYYDVANIISSYVHTYQSYKLLYSYTYIKSTRYADWHYIHVINSNTILTYNQHVSMFMVIDNQIIELYGQELKAELVFSSKDRIYYYDQNELCEILQNPTNRTYTLEHIKYKRAPKYMQMDPTIQFITSNYVYVKYMDYAIYQLPTETSKNKITHIEPIEIPDTSVRDYLIDNLDQIYAIIPVYNINMFCYTFHKDGKFYSYCDFCLICGFNECSCESKLYSEYKNNLNLIKHSIRPRYQSSFIKVSENTIKADYLTDDLAILTLHDYNGEYCNITYELIRLC